MPITSSNRSSNFKCQWGVRNWIRITTAMIPHTKIFRRGCCLRRHSGIQKYEKKEITIDGKKIENTVFGCLPTNALKASWFNDGSMDLSFVHASDQLSGVPSQPDTMDSEGFSPKKPVPWLWHMTVWDVWWWWVQYQLVIALRKNKKTTAPSLCFTGLLS